MTIKTHQVKIYPNRTMTKEINKLFNYRRYCWNLALETWNNMYQQSKEADDKHLLPNNTKVRNHIIPEEGRCGVGNSGAGCFLSCSTWHCNSVSDLNALIELVTA